MYSGVTGTFGPCSPWQGLDNKKLPYLHRYTLHMHVAIVFAKNLQCMHEIRSRSQSDMKQI
jgi:hypothetical protein